MLLLLLLLCCVCVCVCMHVCVHLRCLAIVIVSCVLRPCWCLALCVCVCVCGLVYVSSSLLMGSCGCKRRPSTSPVELSRIDDSLGPPVPSVRPYRPGTGSQTELADVRRVASSNAPSAACVNAQAKSILDANTESSSILGKSSVQWVTWIVAQSCSSIGLGGPTKWSRKAQRCCRSRCPRSVYLEH